jgi:hypothetical protein
MALRFRKKPTQYAMIFSNHYTRCKTGAASLIIHALAGLMTLTSCENKELYLCPQEREALVKVLIQWEEKDRNDLPGKMTVFWYQAAGTPLISDFNVLGGYEHLSRSLYTPICLDDENSGLIFSNFNRLETFEVKNMSVTSSNYGKYVTSVPAEPIVAEANPYRLYVDAAQPVVDIQNLAPGDTAEVYFYPKNILREYTLMVYNVQQTSPEISCSGAISGMSAAWAVATSIRSDRPSTILFKRVERVRKAQTSSRWSNQQKALFAAKNPEWDNPQTGWTGDWIIGTFCTFGPAADRPDPDFCLTIDVVTAGNRYAWGTWGYRNDLVGKQIRGALEGDGTGSQDERQAYWRSRNGGFDIILDNNGRLVIPEDNNGENNGGFDVGCDDWGPSVNVP